MPIFKRGVLRYGVFVRVLQWKRLGGHTGIENYSIPLYFMPYDNLASILIPAWKWLLHSLRSGREVSRRGSAVVLSKMEVDHRTNLRGIKVAAVQSNLWDFTRITTCLFKTHPTDFAVRHAFCNWLTTHDVLISKMRLCDEAQFTQNGINSYHNEHVSKI